MIHNPHVKFSPLLILEIIVGSMASAFSSLEANQGGGADLLQSGPLKPPPMIPLTKTAEVGILRASTSPPSIPSDKMSWASPEWSPYPSPDPHPADSAVVIFPVEDQESIQGSGDQNSN